MALEKKAQSFMDRKEGQCRDSKYSNSGVKLTNKVRRRQAEFLDDVARMGSNRPVASGRKKPGEMKDRDHQRFKIQDGKAAWLGRCTAEII